MNNFEQLIQILNNLKKNILKRVKIDDFKLDLILSSFFLSGHVLLEDMPGLGKTTLAKTLAFSTTDDIGFSRIQFTSDLLPYDIIGIEIFNKEKNNFEFKKGPIFSSIILADELNRGNPKVQSAMLEAMGEKQVTIFGKTFSLPPIFFVIATQNPYEEAGTFPLPISSLDRFMISLSLGYPDKDDEIYILKNNLLDFKKEQIEQVIDLNKILEIKDFIQNLYIDDELIELIYNIGLLSRENNNLSYGFSTRALLHLLNFSKAWALIHSKRDFVTDMDIKEVAKYVFQHRIPENKEVIDIIVDKALDMRVKK